MIKASSLTLKRDDKEIISNLDFSWNKGEKLVILGPNGAGKTTLAMALAGVIDITSGDISLDLKPISDYSLQNLRRKIGIVFQDPESQFVTTDVYMEITFGLLNLGLDRDTVKYRTDLIIEELGLEYLLNRNPSSLSGGEKQMISIAGILAMEPDYIIFDEVTSFLDRESRIKIYNLWKKCDSSIMIITQDFEEVELGDRVILLEDGKISFESSTDELYKHDLIPTRDIKFRKILKKNSASIKNYQHILDILG